MSSEQKPAAEPPKDIWEVNQRLQLDEPVGPDDDRWVETAAARGELSFGELYRYLGVDSRGGDSREWTLRAPPRKAYVLFCGHRGCGKSTELRRVHQKLDRRGLFLSILLDTTTTLDTNNLQYQDVLLALAEALLRRLEKEGVEVEEVHLSRLKSWFDERVEKHEKTHDFAAEIKAGVKAEGGIPFLSKLFAELTTAFRVNSTYKEELRRVVRNHFSELAGAFNQLIAAAEKACQERGLASRVLFLVDGTDRLRGEDADAFFIQDVHQLQLIEALFLYSTPIHLLYGGTALQQSFTNLFKLPMIKLSDRDGKPFPEGKKAMADILYRRAPIELFDDPSTADYLIEHSGGHPRDLLRLLQSTFANARSDLFDRPAAERAVRKLATEYRQILNAEDYPLLRRIDANPDTEHNSERARHLLYNLALLEYNAYWWRSHPVIRTLEAYKAAEKDTAGG
jgi:hypothetical protein